MIFDKDGNTVTISQENISLRQFIEKLQDIYPRVSRDHIILNLFSFKDLNANDLLEFLQLSNRHRAARKSFVLVTQRVSFDEIPDELCVVPSLQEAKDIVEMEEIERDLDLDL